MLGRKKRNIILSCVLALVALGSVGAVWAWNTHHVELDNVLTSHTVKVEIDEYFPDKTVEVGTKTKQVTFKNTGDGAVFIRYTYAEYWETIDELLDGYTNTVTKNWTNENMWTDGGDGWYYYNYVLAAGDSVDVLDSVYFKDTIPEDADYTLMFQAEAVQASDENELNASVTKLLFGIEGQISDATIINGAVTEGDVTWTEVSS